MKRNVHTLDDVSIKTEKILTPTEVDAVLMEKNKGTPQIRSDVVIMGKLVSYDSNEKTEWEGFN